MKRLFLMRHGHSPSPLEAGVKTDALRPLSDFGRNQAKLMGLELKRRGARPAFVLHSPLLRAVETAQAAALELGVSPLALRALDNTQSAEEVLEELRVRGADVDDVLAVGHQPQIGDIATLLTRRAFEIRPAGAVAIAVETAPRLLWTLNAEEIT